MDAKDRIIVALDVDSVEKAISLVEMLKGHVGGFKIGLEFITSMIKQLVLPTNADKEAIPNLRKIRYLFRLVSNEFFWDGKFADIINTVAGASKAVGEIGVKMFNVHCFGGSDEMVAAKKSVLNIPKPPKVLGVTLLTSLRYHHLVQLKIFGDVIHKTDKERMKLEESKVRQLVLDWARLAQGCGLDGVVASPKEIKAIRRSCGDDFLIVTPGIRPKWAVVGDQKRIAPPSKAAEDGADYQVIGRPVTDPPAEIGGPVEAAKKITEEIESVL